MVVLLVVSLLNSVASYRSGGFFFFETPVTDFVSCVWFLLFPLFFSIKFESWTFFFMLNWKLFFFFHCFRDCEFEGLGVIG